MNLHDYGRALRRSWWAIVALAVIGTALALVVALRAAPVYASDVTFFAATPNTSGTNPLAGDTFGQQRVNSYVKLLSSQRLAERVISATGVDLTPAQVGRKIQGRGDLNTVILSATVEDTSPARSLAIARGVSDQFPKMVQQLESQGATGTVPIHLDVVSGPSLQKFPVSPKKRVIVLLGFVIGLLLGLGVALGRMLADRSVRSSAELANQAAAPLIGVVPRVPGGARVTAVDPGGKEGRRQEAIRSIRTNLRFVSIEHSTSVLVITSPGAGEGKSSIAASVAVAFAHAGEKVLLVEADLRRPRVSSYLGLENGVGLTTVLAGEADIADAVQAWGSYGLSFMASGPVPPNPAELLGSRAMADLLGLLRSEFDVVILDTAPVLPVTDAVVTAKLADGALLVARYGRTKRTEVARAAEMLAGVDVRLLGLVLNGTPLKGADAESYGDYRYDPKAEPELGLA